jgi:hypothetical protein
MKKILLASMIASLFLAVLLAAPLSALANNANVSLEKLMERGWMCVPIEGEPHCFNPASPYSNNQSTITVMVFSAEGQFRGTEILWAAHLYNGQPCPQDQIIDLGFAFACHHYAH